MPPPAQSNRHGDVSGEELIQRVLVRKGYFYGVCSLILIAWMVLTFATGWFGYWPYAWGGGLAFLIVVEWVVMGAKGRLGRKLSTKVLGLPDE